MKNYHKIYIDYCNPTIIFRENEIEINSDFLKILGDPNYIYFLLNENKKSLIIRSASPLNDAKISVRKYKNAEGSIIIPSTKFIKKLNKISKKFLKNKIHIFIEYDLNFILIK